MTPTPKVMPKVTVVTSLYNHKKFLPRRVESFQKQTLTDFHWIIVDDCSTDGSYELICDLTRRDPRVTVLRNEVNRGTTYTSQRGFAEATGEYVYRADSDDYCAPEFLSRLSGLLDEHPEVGLAFCRGLHLDMEDGSWGGLPRKKPFLEPGPDVFLRELARYTMKAPTQLFRRSVLEAAGGFHQPYRYSSDWYLSLRVCLLADVAYIDAPLAFHRTHTSNTSGSRRVQLDAPLMETETFKMIDDICGHVPDALKERTEQIRRESYRNVARVHARVAREARADGLTAEAEALERMVEKYLPLDGLEETEGRPGPKQRLMGIASPLIKRMTYRRLPPLQANGRNGRTGA